MAIPVWPLALPTAEYSYKPKTPFTRTDMDDGSARHRRRFRVYPIVVDVRFFMTDEQLGVYEAFAETELRGWVSWFMLRIKDGKGIRLARTRFIEAPEVDNEPGAGVWVIGQIETLVGGNA